MTTESAGAATQKVELLAPAGSFDQARAAVRAGADAVYMGGPLFSARAYAESSSEEGLSMLSDAARYCRLRGKKFYFALNTLVKEKEFTKLSDYLREIMPLCPDAFIVQDVGVLLFLLSKYPGARIHMSTQAAVTGPRFGKFLAGLGAARLILPRELSLEEIKEISAGSGIETEAFVHGALCYAYSGRCLMSSMLGGRSGNRGRCAGSCRLQFDIYRAGGRLGARDEHFPLSMCDLMTLGRLDELLSAGVCSFKIEGRMKSPEYTAAVVSVYRKYLDRLLAGSPARPEESDIRLLAEVYHRGGETDGYLDGQNGRDMIALRARPAFRTRDEEIFHDIRKKYIEGDMLLPLCGAVRIKKGERPALSLSSSSDPGLSVKVESETAVREAISCPITREMLMGRLCKTGGSGFFITRLDIDMDENVFLSASELNKLRRDALSSMEKAILRAHTPRAESVKEGTIPESVLQDTKKRKKETPGLRVTVETQAQLKAVLKFRKAETVFIDGRFFEPKDYPEAAGSIRESGARAGLRLPGISRQKSREYFAFLKSLDTFDEFLFGDLEDLFCFGEMGLLEQASYSLDHSVYMCGRYAAYFYSHLLPAAIQNLRDAERGYEPRAISYPLELSFRELLDIAFPDAELIVYGRAPLMLTAQCPLKTAEGCRRREETLFLEDRKGERLPVKNSCRICLNTIYNAVPLAIYDMSEELEKLSPSFLRMDFTVETGSETESLLCALSSGKLPARFTRGHFRHGF